jgi:hypothetical protein
MGASLPSMDGNGFFSFGDFYPKLISEEESSSSMFSPVFSLSADE